MWRKPSYLVGRHPIWRPYPERSRSLAWGARLESVFPSRERGFESLPRSLSPQGGQERPAQWSGFLSLKVGLRKNAWYWNLDELQTHSCGWAGGTPFTVRWGLSTGLLPRPFVPGRCPKESPTPRDYLFSCTNRPPAHL